MNVLLTAQEVNKAMDERLTGVTGWEAVSKAQAKKLVEWLEEKGLLFHICTFFYARPEERERCEACALRREVGL